MSLRVRLAIAALVAALVGCSSPEATRVRGEGPGADVGNRNGTVQLHSGPSVYYRTPTEGPGIGQAGVPGGSRAG